MEEVLKLQLLTLLIGFPLETYFLYLYLQETVNSNDLARSQAETGGKLVASSLLRQIKGKGSALGKGSG